VFWGGDILENISGIATIEIINRHKEDIILFRHIEVLTIINLHESCIEVYLHESVEKGFDNEYRNILMENDLILRDCRFKLPDGSNIEAEVIGKLFIKLYKPASFSAYDTKLNRMFNYTDKSEGVARFKLIPQNSTLEFKVNPLANIYEINFLNNNVHLILEPSCFEHNGRRIFIAVCETSVSFSSSSDFSDIEKKIWLAWSVLQGCPLTNRNYIGKDNLSISLESVKSYQASGKLYKYINSAFDIFKKLFIFLDGLDADEFEKWEKAFHFYIEGKSSWSNLDIKLINYFIFLDILNGARNLSKDFLAKMLEINHDDASIICEVRNKLIHEEHRLKSAIQSAYTLKKNKFQSFSPKDLDVDGSNSVDPLLFYLKTASLIDYYLIRKIGYSGDWNDQSEIISQVYANR